MRITKAILVFVICFQYSCQNRVYENKISKILNVINPEINSSNGINEFGGFGEGYNLEIYNLSENTIEEFEKQPNKKLPEDIENSKNMKIVDWAKTPVDTSLSEIFLMTLNYSNGNKNLEEQLTKIRNVLKKTETYYSAYYYSDLKNPQEAQVFILDTIKKSLYIIDIKI